MVSGQPVIRLCVRVATLPLDQCAVPNRCELHQCARCDQPVHYDPAASIPALGREVIICNVCIDELFTVVGFQP